MATDRQSLYIQLGQLVAAMPDLNEPLALPRATQEWLGKIGALIAASGDRLDVAEFNTYASSLGNSTMQASAAQNLAVVAMRALAKAELQAPASAQGAFVPAGNAFDALSAVGKVLGQGARDVLIVDPYLDAVVLTDFGTMVRPGVLIRLLADATGAKPSLKPAATRWIGQYGTDRPLVLKLAAPRMLHDRLIVIDGVTVWILTQSLNAFAQRSPASVVRVGSSDLAALKIAAYTDIWNIGVRP